jgi:hypothetical protein
MQHEGVLVVDQDPTAMDVDVVVVAIAALVFLAAEVVSLVELLQEKGETRSLAKFLVK